MPMNRGLHANTRHSPGRGIVAQRVGRYTFLNAGPDGGFVHGLPDDLFGYRFVRTRVVDRAGEHVGLGPHPAVVFAKRVEQFFGQRNFPVDAAFALDHTDHHAPAVYVGHLKAAQLGAAQARCVKGHQHGAVIEDPRRANQMSNLIRTEDHWQSEALFGIWQILLHIAPLEHLDIEEAEGTNVQDNGVDGQLSRSQKVCMVAPEVIGSDLVEWRADVRTEMFYGFQVRVNRGGSVVAADEFFSHPLDECCQRNLL